MPRFCLLEPELLEKFELKSSLFESSSESISSELPHGESWSVGKRKNVRKGRPKGRLNEMSYSNTDLMEGVDIQFGLMELILKSAKTVWKVVAVAAETYFVVK